MSGHRVGKCPPHRGIRGCVHERGVVGVQDRVGFLERHADREHVPRRGDGVRGEAVVLQPSRNCCHAFRSRSCDLCDLCVPNKSIDDRISGRDVHLHTWDFDRCCP